MTGPLVECVPNFSEGRDARRVEAIVAAMCVEGVRLLDWTMDEAHNRSIVTIAGEPAAVLESAIRGAGKAVDLIDLTRQQGEHPRIGAADVIPFVPISGIKLEQCVLLARQAGLEIWRRFGVPVFFYEAAASRPDRANLDEVRQGQFEGLREAVRRESSRRPDLGGPGLHPTAGDSRNFRRAERCEGHRAAVAWAGAAVAEHSGFQGDADLAGVSQRGGAGGSAQGYGGGGGSDRINPGGGVRAGKRVDASIGWVRRADEGAGTPAGNAAGLASSRITVWPVRG